MAGPRSSPPSGSETVPKEKTAQRSKTGCTFCCPAEPRFLNRGSNTVTACESCSPGTRMDHPGPQRQHSLQPERRGPDLTQRQMITQHITSDHIPRNAKHGKSGCPGKSHLRQSGGVSIQNVCSFLRGERLLWARGGVRARSWDQSAPLLTGPVSPRPAVSCCGADAAGPGSRGT